MRCPLVFPRGWIVGALSWIVLPGTAPAAERISAELIYERGDGAESCPDSAELRSLVTAGLGFDPFAPDATLVVAAKVTLAGETFHGTLRTLDSNARSSAERQFEGTSCAQLVETMALSIGILLEPDSVVLSTPTLPERPNSVSRPETLDGGQSQPQAEAFARGGSVPRLSSGPEPELVRRVGLEVIGSLGAAPAMALGGAAIVGIGTTSWSVDVEGRLDLPAGKSRSDATGVRSSLLLGLLVPCWHITPFAVCPLIAVGALRGEGVNVGEPDRVSTFYSAFGLRAGLELPLERSLAARIHAEVLAPVTPTTLHVYGDEVWRTPIAFGSAGIGVMGRFR